jgi:hypothetical protein
MLVWWHALYAQKEMTLMGPPDTRLYARHEIAPAPGHQKMTPKHNVSLNFKSFGGGHPFLYYKYL